MSRAGGKVSSSGIKTAATTWPSRRALLGGVLAAGAALPLGGCVEEYTTYRQRLVMEVDTPAGVKRGETVIEIEVKFTVDSMDWMIPPEGRRGRTLTKRGEALVIDLGQGKYLFALLQEDYTENIASTAVQRAGHPFRTPSEIRETLRKMRKGEIPRRYPLQPDDLPLLVTFTDINDPKTVKRVDPRNLAATFGPGYRLKAAWVEVTDEPVTSGKVEKVLGWLAKTWPNRLDGNRYETINAKNRLANSLSANSFSTEIRGTSQ